MRRQPVNAHAYFINEINKAIYDEGGYLERLRRYGYRVSERPFEPEIVFPMLEIVASLSQHWYLAPTALSHGPEELGNIDRNGVYRPEYPNKLTELRTRLYTFQVHAFQIWRHLFPEMFNQQQPDEHVYMQRV